MKKILSNPAVAGALLICLVISGAALVLNLIRTPDRQEIYERVLTSHHLRLSRNLPPDTAHFFGASTIQGLYLPAIIDASVNFGIGGETSAGLANRLPHYPSLKTAAAVVIQSGFNDRRSLTVEHTRQNYAKMFDTIPRDVDIYLVTYQPARGAGLKTVLDTVLELNDLLREVCAQEPRCLLVDLYSELSNSREPALEADGVHLNPHGYDVLSDMLINAMRKQ